MEVIRKNANIIVALDVPNASRAWKLLDALVPYRPFVKVGMQLYYAEGPAFVEQLLERGYDVFLDLKLHDIPRTVQKAAESLTRLGVQMFNVHALGGRAMMEAAREGVEAANTAARNRPTLIAVTQLTSTDQAMLNDDLSIAGTIEGSVRQLAVLSKRSGMDGVVCSAHEISVIKSDCGDSFLTVTPGIRPRSAAYGDQKRVMTPAQAAHAGTDYMVIGRPINQAPNPAQALCNIHTELEQGGKR